MCVESGILHRGQTGCYLGLSKSIELQLQSCCSQLCCPVQYESLINKFADQQNVHTVYESHTFFAESRYVILVYLPASIELGLVELLNGVLAEVETAQMTKGLIVSAQYY